MLDRAATMFERELSRRIGAELDDAAVRAVNAAFATVRAAGEGIDGHGATERRVEKVQRRWDRSVRHTD